MRSTANWLAHKKVTNGRTPARKSASTLGGWRRPTGRTKVQNYAWTYHCPCFGQLRITQGTQVNPIIIPTQSACSSVPVAPLVNYLQHLVNNPEVKTFQKHKPSEKYVCPSKFTVPQIVDNSLLEVKWFWKNIGHKPCNIEHMCLQQMLAAL